jgi:hypothetical protein
VEFDLSTAETMAIKETKSFGNVVGLFAPLYGGRQKGRQK